jgi:hypothetical protein
MQPSSTVVVMRMNKVILVGSLLAGLLGLAGCGQLVSEEGHDCPCSAGWACCAGVCVAASSCSSADDAIGNAHEVCPGSVDLGTEAIGQPDASAGVPITARVTSYVKGYLEEGTRVPFDYASSIWTNDSDNAIGFSFNSWLLPANNDQAFTFQLYAAEDAGVNVTLPLQIYGPLKGLDVGCNGSLQPEGTMQGDIITWKASGQEGLGLYLVVPYHQVTVTVTDAGPALSYSGFDIPAYANAFIMMQPADAD